MNFNHIFQSGYDPAVSLPTAPLVAEGTLAHKIYHRSPEHTTLRLNNDIGDWTFKVDTDGPSRSARITVKLHYRNDSSPIAASVYLPEPRVDRHDRFDISTSLISSSTGLLNLDEIDYLNEVIDVSAELAAVLDLERGHAFAEELVKRQAEWDAGATKREVQAEHRKAVEHYNKTVAAIFSDLQGETVRLSSTQHRYRSTGVVSIVGDRSVELKLPRSSRGRVKNGYWELTAVEWERFGKFRPVALPKRPDKPAELVTA